MVNILKVIALSLLKTLLLAAAIGGIAAIFHGNYWLWGIVTFILQIVVFYFYNTWLEYKAATFKRMMDFKEAELLATMTMNVQCANCKVANEILIKTNSENRFVCGSCRAKNSVYLIAETAIVTEPIQLREPTNV